MVYYNVFEALPINSDLLRSFNEIDGFVMKTFLFRMMLMFGWVVLPLSVAAQLSSPNRVSARLSAYSPADSLYFFSNMESARLKAVAIASSQFRWTRYNKASGMFDQEVFASSGVESVFMPGDEGGYRVEIETASGDVQIHRCWCFAPKVTSVGIKQSQSTCFLVSLESDVNADSIAYFHPQTNEPFREAQQLSFYWTTDPELPLYKADAAHQHNLDAPVENVVFHLSVTNEGGQVSEASFNHEAKAVLAGFEYEVVDRGWDHELGDGEELSAPATLRFNNQSKGNITAYEWVFRWSLENQNSTSRLYEVSPVYTFQQPGNYDLYLLVTNERSGCSNESSVKSLKVMESYIAFPNVFTPNGDGVNDEFRPLFQSIKGFSIVIYNRWGKKVYESSDLGKGWDGKIGGREAAEGVYYYVCEAEGYLKGERHRKKGSVTILR